MLEVLLLLLKPFDFGIKRFGFFDYNKEFPEGLASGLESPLLLPLDPGTLKAFLRPPPNPPIMLVLFAN